MSGDNDNEYFSDGIAEEILNALAQVDGLRVAGRTSSFYFKGKNEDLAVIGDKLHVATLLEGSVRKSGNRVRITAQLINARDGFHLWSKQYDRELTDIFKVQGELALAVVDALKVKLLSGAAAAPRVHEARDPEAHRLLLLGRSQNFRQTAESLAQAAANLAKAVAIDPAYAPAWHMLSIVHGNLALNAPRSEIPRRAQEALAEVDRAIAIDGDFAEALGTRGWIRGNLLWDWPGAKADLQRALQLNPRSEGVLHTYAGFVTKAGRLSESIALLRKAAELDPLDAYIWTNLGANLMQDGQLGPAREAFFRAEEVSPHNELAAASLLLLDLLEGHPAKALDAAGKLPDKPLRLLNIAIAQHELGHARESAAALDALVAKVPSDEPDVAYWVAAVHAWRGERDQAFEWLETAYKRRELRLRMLRVEPHFRSLRGDPRLLALLKKMNLPLD
ncbi:MAG TPA: tetratricopeptide repeat protein [Myxococcaceae bacterium]|nr:tetratricopeptide repeat protein [Myxococcaceae bacterium]